jgi:hypothetical protein
MTRLDAGNKFSMCGLRNASWPLESIRHDSRGKTCGEGKKTEKWSWQTPAFSIEGPKGNDRSQFHFRESIAVVTTGIVVMENARKLQKYDLIPMNSAWIHWTGVG